MLTTGGTVLHVDRDTWTTTPVLEDVALLLPSPDGRAFMYRPRLADESPGEVRVRVLASGAEFTVASVDEAVVGTSWPWWSVDGSMFAVQVDIAGQRRDRVLSLPSGASAVTPAGSYVQHELGAGAAVWLTNDGDTEDSESYWEPFADVLRPLYTHSGVPSGYRRAAADGLEIIELSSEGPAKHYDPGTLRLIPWDGAAPRVLAEGVYPWYRRLADGRVLTTRPIGSYQARDPMDLVLIDGDDERRIDRAVSALGPSYSGVGNPDSYYRVVGDLLLYAVRDDAGPRSGVWAVNLSRL